MAGFTLWFLAAGLLMGGGAEGPPPPVAGGKDIVFHCGHGPFSLNAGRSVVGVRR
jgi:hypothetical protein